MKHVQELNSQMLNSLELREKCRAAGVSWPPEAWQRVEITGNLFPNDPAGPLLGTVLARDGSYTLVLLDRHLTLRDPYTIRECYWDNELRPVLTSTAPGWVPLALYKQRLADWANPIALDMKLTNGKYAFNCWPKRDAANFYTFNEMDKPHGRYTEHHVTAVRPEGA